MVAERSVFWRRFMVT